MFDYITIGSTDFEASKKFFNAVLGTLGYSITHDYEQYGTVGYGDPAQKEDPNASTAWLMKEPNNGKPATVGNGSMVCFRSPTRAQVDAFHAAALANGGTSEGAPGIRMDYGPNMYLAYVRDPMGNKFSVLCSAEH
jgi:catechol 2,3-dioxygenase-like lactoylglutathione lyase family enzyme